MSFKTLFDKASKISSLANKSAEEIGGEVESTGYHRQDIIDESRFIPNLDFSDPSSFAHYGSAEEYYVQSIERIYETYPYDGSLKERLEWENESTYIDLHILDNLYPRTNGFALISATGWGSLDGSKSSGYGLPQDLEYIFFKGGPHPNPNGMSPYATAFTGSNYYDTSTNRESNLKYDLQNNGVSVEFWLNKDAFDNTKTEKEIIFDLWNGRTFNTPTYGRLTIEMSGAADNGQNPFLITALSGTTGITRASLTSDTTFTTASVADGLWHHYAVTLMSVRGKLESRFYVDGTLKDTISHGPGVTAINEVTGTLRANLGAAITTPAGTAASIYSGKLSGSLDEFRYWKTRRTSKDIGRFWFTQVGGGTNTDPAPNSDTQEDVNTNLGVYFKFNEGITGVTATDQKVLDYSGRVSNGTWTGYSTSSRSTGSAMVLSLAATKEFKDPIIYSGHPEVSSLKTGLQNSGSAYDVNNVASLYNSIPSWIAEEDAEGAKQAKYLTQILSSYFDTLHMQIGSLNELKNIDYVSGSNKPLPFSDRKLNSQGFVSPDIFVDADLLEKLADRSEERVYDKSLNDIKNIIYQNIYNNLSYIYKSKGTEKAFRNLIRCFGIDEELVKLKMYADNTVYEFRDNRKNTLIKDSFANFNTNQNQNAVVYSFSSSLNPNSTGFLPAATQLTGGYALTFEVDAQFPQKTLPSAKAYISTNAISSSVFGVHGANANETQVTWPSDDAANFQVLTIRDERDSENAYFMLTGSAGGYVPQLTSSLYEDLYTDSTWNLAVRIKPENYPLTNFADGADSGNYTVVFSGIETRSGEVVNTFTVSGAVSSPPNTFITGSRRVFVGAHRTNITGALLQTSDARINATRVWLNYLDDAALRQHALDSRNHGSFRPSKYAFAFDKGAEATGEVLNFDTLALNWEFTQNTGSDAGGEFVVEDESSGSAALASSRFDWAGDILNKQVMAKGQGFSVSSTDAIKKDYIIAARLNDLETIAPAETIQVLSAEDQKVFKIDSRPINYYFSFEKSMSEVISQEILNWFGTLKDFNNLVGDPVNRYRGEYKDLRVMRQRYFEKVANDEIDFDKFYEFYKWFDSSLSFMLGQLVPASAQFSENIQTVIESHALERSKYRNVFQFVDQEGTVFSGTLQSNVDYGEAISSPDDDPQGTGFYPAHAPTRRATGLSTREMLNKWKYVHAPVDADQKKKYLWWKNEAERNNPTISENTAVNNSRGGILNSIRQTAQRELDRPYRFSMAGLSELNGVGASHNKKVNFVFEATQPYGPTKTGTNIPINIMLTFDTDVESLLDTTDEFYPTYKQRLGFGINPDINRANNDKRKMNGNTVAPFSLYETSEQTTVNSEISSSFKSGVTITNLHHDFVSDTAIPAQGPFTEKFVGGRRYRHTEINAGSDTRSSRAEGFRLALGLNSTSEFIPTGAVGALGIVSPNYPFPDSPAGSAPDGFLPDLPVAQRFRDEVAKRPVNIKNILMTTASVGTRLSGALVHSSVGNYQKNYQVVQTSGRSINDPFFRDQSFSFAPNPETLATRGRFPLVVTSTENVGGDLDYALPDRTGTNSNNTVFVSLFSSPGSYEASSRGYRDPAHEEKSAYNALPYRNLGVINRGLSGSNTDASLSTTIRVNDHLDKPRGLNQLATLHAGRFGYDPVFGSVPSLTYITQPSFHKTNRNTKTVVVEGGTNKSVFDNLFVQHSIPRSQQQYSWLTASLEQGRIIYDLDSPTCYSASVINELIISGSDYEDLTFVGLNTRIADPLTASSHILGFALATTASSAYLNGLYWSSPALTKTADYFNFITTTRNGPYGYPTWKQIRTGETPVARKLRETNRISLALPPPEVSVSLTNGTTYQTVRGLKSNGFVDYTEQPVSSRFKSTMIMLEDNSDTPNTDNNATINISHGNNIDFFSNQGLNNRLNITQPSFETTPLNTALDYVVGSKLSTIIDYGERIYPSETNVYKNAVRKRTAYTIDNIWNDSRSERTDAFVSVAASQPAITSYGQEVYEQSIWPLDGHRNFTTTLPTAFRMATADGPGVTSGSGELLNVYTRFYSDPGPSSFNGSRDHTRTGPVYASRVPAGSASVGTGPTADLVFAGDAEWLAAQQSGKKPYKNYSSYSERIALIGKDHSIVPEFRISDLIETYIDTKSEDFLADVDNIFNLTGAALYDSSESDFFKTYTNSDFIKYFSVVDDSLHDKRAGDLKIKRDKLSLSCNALIKFLPYKGFYPAERTLEIATLLSTSYGDHIEVDIAGAPTSNRNASFRAFVEPLVSPGILFNTIKSGLAVSNYVLTNTGSDASSIKTNSAIPTANCALTNLPEGTVQYEKLLNVLTTDPTNAKNRGYQIQKLPFETLQRPLAFLEKGFISGSGAVFDTGISDQDELAVRSGGFISGSDYIKINAGQKFYELAIDNFLCETTNFFMDGLTSFRSKREDQFQPVVSGSVYRMKAELFRTLDANLQVDREAFDLYARESAFGYPLGQSLDPGTYSAQSASFNHVVPPYYHGQGLVDFVYNATVTGIPTLDEILANSQITFNTTYPWDVDESISVNLGDSFNLTQFFTEVPEGTNEQKKVWLLQSKFETPVLNFANVTTTAPPASQVDTGLSSSAQIKINGMWHQYGTLPAQENEGIFFRIKEGAGENSLAKIVGFEAGIPKKIGKTKTAGLLEEAVIAIPFKTVANRREFFSITKDNERYANIEELLQKYVFPPKFDFVINKTVTPILMYGFEFSATLTQKDITDMWQNLPPDIADKFEQQEVVIDDKQILELLAGDSDEIQWMVFKVKKRAKKDFDKVRRQMVSDDVSAFPQTVGDYTYNWPYDYFSLVELVKIDETVRYVSDDLTEDPDRQG